MDSSTKWKSRRGAPNRGKKGKREYLNNLETDGLMKSLNLFFEHEVQVPKIKVGNRQTIETLINEEALLLARFLKDEKTFWNPRIAELS